MDFFRRAQPLLDLSSRGACVSFPKARMPTQIRTLSSPCTALLYYTTLGTYNIRSAIKLCGQASLTPHAAPHAKATRTEADTDGSGEVSKDEPMAQRYVLQGRSSRGFLGSREQGR